MVADGQRSDHDERDNGDESNEQEHPHDTREDDESDE